MERNRLTLVALAVGVAALVAVVLVLVVGHGGSSAGSTTSTSASTVTSAAPLGSVPQHGDTLGKPGAPVSLVVFEDPQCPYCRSWNVDSLSTVVSQFVQTGRIKLVYRGVVIIGPDSVRGLRAIYAAGLQNKLWDMADELYARQRAENSGWITNRVILEAAAAAGANGKAVLANMGAPAVSAALRQAQADAKAAQLQGTPTFVLEQPPAVSRQLNVPGLDPSSFVAALSAALQQG